METSTKLPHELCPRFERCSVNVCPLHPDYKKLQSFDSDPEPKCTLPKSIRKRLGVSLAWKGMSDRELSSQAKWDSLPESEKQERIAKLKKNSLIVRLSEKGYMIAPKSSSEAQKTHTNEATMPLNAKENVVSDGLEAKE